MAYRVTSADARDRLKVRVILDRRTVLGTLVWVPTGGGHNATGNRCRVEIRPGAIISVAFDQIEPVDPMVTSRVVARP